MSLPRVYRSEEFDEVLVLLRKGPKTCSIMLWTPREGLRWHERWSHGSLSGYLQACEFRRIRPPYAGIDRGVRGHIEAAQRRGKAAWQRRGRLDAIPCGGLDEIVARLRAQKVANKELQSQLAER